jgi:hypothetical protein
VLWSKDEAFVPESEVTRDLRFRPQIPLLRGRAVLYVGAVLALLSHDEKHTVVLGVDLPVRSQRQCSVRRTQCNLQKQLRLTPPGINAQ